MDEEGVFGVELINVMLLEEGATDVERHGQVPDDHGAHGETNRDVAKAEVELMAGLSHDTKFFLSFGGGNAELREGLEVILSEAQSQKQVIGHGRAGCVAAVDEGTEAKGAKGDGGIFTVGLGGLCPRHSLQALESAEEGDGRDRL